MRIATFILAFLCLAPLARGADDFAKQIDLDPLKPLSIQHNQTLKTLDSFSRQVVSSIVGKRTLDGQPAMFTLLDMTFRPQVYREKNIIKIKNVPLRQDFAALDSIDAAEKKRIVVEGTVSLKFWLDPKVQQLMAMQQQSAVFKADAINQVQNAATTLQELGRPNLASYKVFAPPTLAANDTRWHEIDEMYGSVPEIALMMQQTGGTPLTPLPGYTAHARELRNAIVGLSQLRESWMVQDAEGVNRNIAVLAANLPEVSPVAYPSVAKRKAEVVYNKLFQLTIPAIMCYFVAFVLFMTAAYSGSPSLRLWGLRTMVIALLVHTAGIAIRWWLVEKSVGNWFESIPIKNMFESVMFSAWFGALIGLLLEMRNGRSFFGAAASFVGLLSMVALFTVPFFFKEIGGEISQVAGVLMSYWLYIHVTMVTASYALIGMAFLLSCVWLVKYYSAHHTLSRTAGRQLSGDARGFDVVPSGGGAVVGIGSTLARMLFVPQAVEARRDVPLAKIDVADEPRSFLVTLDACNLVVLQLAFWILGVGVILGAVWADMSWGRPWGWDPKETFALVTWIVYLVVVHVRVATEDKAWWTAVLSVIGFFVMLFNWVGVNFFLVGLHSYA